MDEPFQGLEYIHVYLDDILVLTTGDWTDHLTKPEKGKSTYESNYITETLLEMYHVEELLNGTSPLKFTTINHYQREYPGIEAKSKSTKYKKYIFV